MQVPRKRSDSTKSSKSSQSGEPTFHDLSDDDNNNDDDEENNRDDLDVSREVVADDPMEGASSDGANNGEALIEKVYDDYQTDKLSKADDTIPTPQLGALYSPWLLSDYGGTAFEFEESMLAQQDIVDSEGSLIAPWELYEKMTPGSLVLMQAKMFVWHTSKSSDRRVCFATDLSQPRR